MTALENWRCENVKVKSYSEAVKICRQALNWEKHSGRSCVQFSPKDVSMAIWQHFRRMCIRMSLILGLEINLQSWYGAIKMRHSRTIRFNWFISYHTEKYTNVRFIVNTMWSKELICKWKILITEVVLKIVLFIDCAKWNLFYWFLSLYLYHQ